MTSSPELKNNSSTIAYSNNSMLMLRNSKRCSRAFLRLPRETTFKTRIRLKMKQVWCNWPILIWYLTMNSWRTFRKTHLRIKFTRQKEETTGKKTWNANGRANATSTKTCIWSQMTGANTAHCALRCSISSNGWWIGQWLLGFMISVVTQTEFFARFVWITIAKTACISINRIKTS